MRLDRTAARPAFLGATAGRTAHVADAVVAHDLTVPPNTTDRVQRARPTPASPPETGQASADIEQPPREVVIARLRGRVHRPAVDGAERIALVAMGSGDDGAARIGHRVPRRNRAVNGEPDLMRGLDGVKAQWRDAEMQLASR
jgi:hypothetical protein